MRAIALCFVLLVTLTEVRANPTEIFISPNGNDTNNGQSRADAVATLERAKELVRAISNTNDVIVELTAGDYPLTAPINFSVDDSGQNGHVVVYHSIDGIGKARLIGGIKATNWEVWKGDIFRANIGTGLSFTTLYENGIRADLARWPKRTSPYATSRAGYLTEVDDDHGTIQYQNNAETPDGASFDPATAQLDHAWIYYWDGGDGHRWCCGNKPLKLKSPLTDSTIISQNGGFGYPVNSFLIEGSLDLLSQPGEFYYDSAEGWLYYRSRFPGNIQQQKSSHRNWSD